MYENDIKIAYVAYTIQRDTVIVETVTANDTLQEEALFRALLNKALNCGVFFAEYKNEKIDIVKFFENIKCK